jgi:SPP1 family predicted phage head-tail adaptor
VERAGKFNKRVAIDTATESKGASGQKTSTWGQYAVVWAQVQPLRGREQLQAAAVVAEFDTIFRPRWAPAIDLLTTKIRLRYRGVIYDVKSIANVNMANRMVELTATSGVSANG